MAETGQRARTRTMASADSKWSHRSRKSDGDAKMDLTESPKDKMKITGKADPSRALTELQPGKSPKQATVISSRN